MSSIIARFDSVLEGKIQMKDLCIGCGDMEVAAEHPLFDGGLCLHCKVGAASGGVEGEWWMGGWVDG